MYEFWIDDEPTIRFVDICLFDVVETDLDSDIAFLFKVALVTGRINLVDAKLENEPATVAEQQRLADKDILKKDIVVCLRYKRY